MGRVESALGCPAPDAFVVQSSRKCSSITRSATRSFALRARGFVITSSGDAMTGLRVKTFNHRRPSQVHLGLPGGQMQPRERRK